MIVCILLCCVFFVHVPIDQWATKLFWTADERWFVMIHCFVCYDFNQSNAVEVEPRRETCRRNNPVQSWLKETNQAREMLIDFHEIFYQPNEVRKY